jgi:hypothetical protein
MTKHKTPRYSSELFDASVERWIPCNSGPDPKALERDIRDHLHNIDRYQSGKVLCSGGCRLVQLSKSLTVARRIVRRSWRCNC